MKLVRLVAALAALALAGALSAGADSTSDPRVSATAEGERQTSRVVDRTFVCGVKLRAGDRRIEPSAWSGFRDGGRWEWLPRADVGGRDIISFVSIAAGSPAPSAGPTTPPTTRWVSVDARPCKPSSARVSLSRRGLNGGQASQFQNSDEYECPAPSRILVRMRADFESPVGFRAQSLYQGRYYSTASAVPARRAAFVVTTLTAKPLAYATVSETGTATLFTAPSCTPD